LLYLTAHLQTLLPPPLPAPGYSTQIPDSSVKITGKYPPCPIQLLDGFCRKVETMEQRKKVLYILYAYIAQYAEESYLLL
jgi:hypothetical protein